MNASTKRKLEILMEFIEEDFANFIKQYPTVLGCHVHKKVTGAIEKSEYVLRFYIRKKAKRPKYRIPENIKITSKTGDIVIAKTEVVEQQSLIDLLRTHK